MAARRRSPPRGGRGGPVEVDSELAGDRVDLVRGRAPRGRGARTRAGWRTVDRRVLLEQDHLDARLDRPPALVGLDQSGEAFEQGRLARAVAADQGQPVARADEQVESAEQPAGALDEAEIFISEDGGGHGGAR